MNILKSKIAAYNYLYHSCAQEKKVCVHVLILETLLPFAFLPIYKGILINSSKVWRISGRGIINDH